MCAAIASSTTTTTTAPADGSAAHKMLMTGATPRLSVAMWDKVTVYHLDIGDQTITRRMDNDFVNGTKLLNVVGMSRGKRDNLLKNEAERTVVKLGQKIFKGVWYGGVVAFSFLLFVLFIREMSGL
jgi:hypothetical protein